ncbi:MAG: GNAT family N-acetyltransferase [candidate division WOR-3 bacterium]
MLQRDLVMRTEKLSTVRSAWQELFDRSSGATPFVSYEWFAALASNLLKTDPEVLLFCRNHGAAGIVPASVTGNVLKLIGDERVTDLIGMVGAPHEQEEVVDLLARHVLKNDLRMDLYPLDEHAPLVTGLVRRVPGSVVEKKDACPLLGLVNTWDEYLAGLGGKARHELRRKLNKVNGVRVKGVKPADTGRLFELMTAADSNKAGFLNADMRGFFQDVVEAFDKRGWLRMREAVIDRGVLGMLLAFGFNERVYLFNMGHNVELRSLSPGIVTVALDIRSAIDERYKYYDFLRGDEEYKYRLGAVKRYTVRVSR